MAAKKPVPYSNPAWAGYVSAGYGIQYGGAGVDTMQLRAIAAANKKKAELAAKKKAAEAAAKKGKPPHVNTSSKPPGTKDTGTPPPTQPGPG